MRDHSGATEAQEDGYLAACEIVKLKPSIDWQTFTRDEVLAARPIDTRTGRPVSPDDLKAEYQGRTFDDDLIIPDRINAMCADLFGRLCPANFRNPAEELDHSLSVCHNNTILQV